MTRGLLMGRVFGFHRRTKDLQAGSFRRVLFRIQNHHGDERSARCQPGGQEVRTTHSGYELALAKNFPLTSGDFFITQFMRRPFQMVRDHWSSTAYGSLRSHQCLRHFGQTS
jgi:hypothetical protein